MGQLTQESRQMGLSERGRSRPITRALLLLGFARVVITSMMAAQGAVALSDDDFARVTIAQRFAANPVLDPTGTSWLPLPFWLMGTGMRLLDASLETARSLSTAFAVAATWLLYAGGRLWGLPERSAFAAALCVNLVPAVAMLGGMTVPEVPTAALCVFALLAVSGAHSDSAEPEVTAEATARRKGGPAIPVEVWAGLAAAAATLSRYEAWPVAGVVALVTLFRVWRRRAGWRRSPSLLPATAYARWAPLAGAPIAMMGVLGWVVHNRVAHGDALSFLRRVAHYRAALGVTGGASSASYAAALVGGCPAVALSLVMLILLFRRRDREGLRAMAPRLFPLILGACAVVAFLVVGDAVGGSPTHHPERALLVVWMVAVFACARILSVYRPPSWWWTPVALLLVLDHRRQLAELSHPRATEELVGRQLRALVPPGARVVVSTPDYGYFAVLAAFARPGDAIIDRAHDPRSPQPGSIFGDTWNAPGQLAALGASWVVAPTSSLFPSALRVRTHSGALAVFELEPARKK